MLFATDPVEISPGGDPGPIYSMVELPAEAGISLEVVPAYWLNDGLEALVKHQPLKTYRNKYALLALREKESVRGLKGAVFELRARGYEPVILHRDPRKFAKFKLPAL